jgi:hypothetical protein
METAIATRPMVYKESKLIPLTKGFNAIIDAEDYEKVSSYKWHIRKGRNRLYARRYSKETKKSEDMGRTIMAVPVGCVPDHINGDGLDNRKENLRVATNQQNSWNRKKPSRVAGTRSRFKGVTPFRKAWHSQIRINDKLKCLGTFPCQFCAALTYDMKALELFGEFAKPNILRRS